ncbi:Paf1-domain-containing protein [Lophiostoma macrostomum CBS 122681]|uniref:Paf1-domain-containing protein n=1 Tax=Lophiostoma macrostomum CBS 122681 TaxID=1314788 RepID=A0A6A6ST98_9PLEO|nr:Paf1-domain-containing protein [Lophiostoma macrostomum CBS 122681]
MANSTRPAFHQDYIARIRYSNALPPPPCPPKLLDIPNTGLSSGQYTSASFASRLAREQPLNIEADAELGMPIDLVGIPGVFDGDESAIQAMEKPQPLHPADRALLRPPNALGKPATGISGISFLRRTEYTTSHTTGGSQFESSNAANTMRMRRKRQRADVSRDHPLNIARNIQKGFNLAYPADAYNGPDTDEKVRAAEISPEEKQAWKNPKNPVNPNLKLLDSYPLVPDWDAVPDTGAYMMYKFAAPPVQSRTYDERLDVALLRPAGQTIEDEEEFLAAQAAYKDDPSQPAPIAKYLFEFFLPPDRSKIAGIKRNFSTFDPDNEDEVPFDKGETEDGGRRNVFRYENIRTYETRDQFGDPAESYGDMVAVALHDPESHPNPPLRESKLQKAAYFYPISQKTSIRPKRPHTKIAGEEEQQKVDIIETVARDPSDEVEKRDAIRKRYDLIEA